MNGGGDFSSCTNFVLVFFVDSHVMYEIYFAREFFTLHYEFFFSIFPHVLHSFSDGQTLILIGNDDTCEGDTIGESYHDKIILTVDMMTIIIIAMKVFLLFLFSAMCFR